MNGCTPGRRIPLLGGAIARLTMLYELQKTGVLTDEEFLGIKSRLLDL